MKRRIESIGARALGTVAMMRGILSLFRRTLAGAARRAHPEGSLVEQAYAIGNKSVVFVLVTMGFVGMVMVYQSCLQLDRITGDLSQIGPQFVKALVQDFGPTITCLMLATRVGAGIAAEVGSMKVTEQIDALRMSGITPIDYLIVPRFIASLIMTYVLVVFGCAIAFGAGGLTAFTSYDVNPRVFFDLSAIGAFDITMGAIKTFTYGAAIPIISGYCGMNAVSSSEGVGQATTNAVIRSSFAVILLGFFISGAGLIVQQHT